MSQNRSPESHLPEGVEGEEAGFSRPLPRRGRIRNVPPPDPRSSSGSEARGQAIPRSLGVAPPPNPGGRRPNEVCDGGDDGGEPTTAEPPRIEGAAHGPARSAGDVVRLLRPAVSSSVLSS